MTLEEIRRQLSVLAGEAFRLLVARGYELVPETEDMTHSEKCDGDLKRHQAMKDDPVSQSIRNMRTGLANACWIFDHGGTYI